MPAEPDFGNWLRLRRVAALVGVGVVLILITFAIPSLWSWLLLVFGLTIFATGIFLSYVYYAFHDHGGGLQRVLWRLTLDHLEGYKHLSGNALDIGTGNGSLAVISASDNPGLRVVGIDLWEPGWEYSLADCQANASRAGISERCTFQQASAHVLPFPDETFDCVMSHFVFHEVNAAKDKRSVVMEAFRVLRKGGAFSFHDMFFDTELYGDHRQFIDFIKASGVAHVRFVDSRQLIKVGPLLMNKRALGRCAIICGVK